MHASSSLFFDVFEQYDPDNLLLQQARFEVLRQQFEIARLRPALERVCRSRLVVTHPPKPTPFAFPLLVERMRDMVSSEQLGDRVLRMVKDLEREADER
jgi:ATP-dependent Lhr-like helicase